MSNYNINIGSTKLFVSSSDSKLQCPICGLQIYYKGRKGLHFELQHVENKEPSGESKYSSCSSVGNNSSILFS